MNNKRKIHYDVWISLGLFAFMGWVWYLTTTFRQADKTAVYPRFLIGIMAALNILMLIGGLRKSAAGNEEKIDVKGMKMPLISLLIIAAYEFLFIKTNYFIATPLFLIALFSYLKQRNWKLMIALIACYLVMVYLVFVLLLKVKLL